MLRVEPLDDRICPTATLSGQTLLITGTNVNDYVTVSFAFLPTGNVIVVNEAYGHAGTAPIELPTSYFPASSVNLIYFAGNDGDDSLANKGAPYVMVANGGNGNDTLSGGSAGDILYGDAGNDTLSGGVGNDWLDGGEDNDVISGSSGDDTLRGGLGDDQLVGGVGADRMYGEGGNDSFAGAPDGAADVISGGSGYDVIYGDFQYGFDPLDQVTGVELWIL